MRSSFKYKSSKLIQVSRANLAASDDGNPADIDSAAKAKAVVLGPGPGPLTGS